jgi:hypothetical protein
MAAVDASVVAEAGQGRRKGGRLASEDFELPDLMVSPSPAHHTRAPQARPELIARHTVIIAPARGATVTLERRA